MTDDCCGDKLSDSLKEKFNRFLKDNPLFLRSCLLYKYFEKNHFSEARSSFLEDVGNDVVDRKDLDYWFNLFEKGKIAEYKKPIKNMYKAMWDDKQSLRTCVLYELMRSDDFPDPNKGLIRNKYNRFCNNMRGAVMNYDEFEFWFNRFQTEVFDMDIDWDKMKKYAELNNISIGESIKIHEEKDQRVLMLQKYLKNNPIALRNFLLYNFIKAWTFTQSVFSSDIGRVLYNWLYKKEIFYFWLDLFRQKKITVGEEPRPTFNDNLWKSDKQSVLTCILYESIRSIGRNEKDVLDPVFKKYMTSFSTVMSYKEFNSWYYRFHEGQFDMDIEPKYDQNVPELNRLPELVIENVIDRLSYVDRCSLRRMSYKLCRIIDNRRITIDSLNLELSENRAIISYGTDRISYIQHENVCHIDFGRRKTKLKTQNPLELALKDLSLLLKNPKLKIKRLNVEFKDLAIYIVENDDDYWRNLYMKVINGPHKKIYNAFKSINHQIHVESISIKADFIDESLNILPFLKPGILEKIEIDVTQSLENIENISETNQWKQASHFESKNILFYLPIDYFFHFKTFKIQCSEITAGDVRRIREKLFKSPHFQSCTITVREESYGDEYDYFFPQEEEEVDRPFEDIKRELGEPLPDNNYHFSIPNSNECFQLKLYEPENRIEIERKKKNN